MSNERIKAQEKASDFSPRILEVVDNPPLPIPGLMLRIIALFLLLLILWATKWKMKVKTKY